jgi:hypothetical protein
MTELYRDHNSRVFIVFKEGRKFFHALCLKSGVVVVRFEKKELRHMRPIENYPVRLAAKRFRAAGRALGITPAATKALREVLTSK